MHPFRAAIEADDLDAACALLADDIVFWSPVAHKPYRGRELVSAIIRSVAAIVEDFAYDKQIGAEDSPDHALLFQARVGEFSLYGCDFVHTGADGLIDEFTVMLRPLKAVHAFADRMAAHLAASAPQVLASAPPVRP
jgi:hypothetical protein